MRPESTRPGAAGRLAAKNPEGFVTPGSYFLGDDQPIG